MLLYRFINQSKKDSPEARRKEQQTEVVYSGQGVDVGQRSSLGTTVILPRSHAKTEPRWGWCGKKVGRENVTC